MFFLLACLALAQHQVVVSAHNQQCPPGTEKVVYNFNRYPDGSKARGGDMAEDVWGETDTTEGVRMFGENLRIFDSSNPTTGNEDLASPNKGCEICDDQNIACPGDTNEGYDQGSASTNNCRPQREILVFGIEGEEKPVPNENGGYMDIYFDFHVPKLLSIGLMNVESGYRPFNNYQIMDGLGQTITYDEFDEGLGKNTFQQHRFNLFNPFIVSEMYLQFDSPVGIAHLKFCASVPDDPQESICSNDSVAREAAFQRLVGMEDEFLVVRYNNFNLGPGLYPPILLGDCCYLENAGSIRIRACGASGESIEYDSFVLPDRKGTPEAVEYLAGRLRDAAKAGACCRGSY